MEVAVIGINHNNSPIEVREKFFFSESMKIESSDQILDKSTKEIIIVSTCNRSEIYVASDNIDLSIDEVKEFYKEFFKFSQAEDYIFVKKRRDAVVHLYMVAAGLDSMVLGEDQILGQIRESMTFSMNLGFSKKVLNRLFMDAIFEGKKIRSKLKISEIPLSTSYIGINLLKKEIGSLNGKKALIIGAGEIGTLAIKYLYEEELEQIYVTNRTYEKVKEICKDFDKLTPIEYDVRYDILENIDILITATGAPHTIITHRDIKKLPNRLYILDLALPRDVDPKIGEKENVILYHNDDLQKMSEENLLRRKELSEEAIEIINGDVGKYINWITTLDVDPVIESLNKRCFSIKEDTMNYINRKVELDKREKKIIDKMIMSALKKFIREPIKILKKADEENSEEYIEIMKRLFQI
ncbi:glutamyl-tRNA reductase [Tissierella carlieri]|jgi:glutamyl-tRNA reductase|uniref:Glutamyl-tRNA reductase n=1 Tax=Tissierella carlieri TaxID=689904 RepID=A0ABT1S9Z3_9FIRM|nr:MULTISPECIES: glutamyl-tRNA reductase [Tissierella]MBU5314340.1 glutamyl-tRNA reductase [Tissierella carlieri]MCQ4923268.1 glutamyl-tRNA reductase [Tissierella carlieri]MDU5080661.1 glutamyl-tRNA reductase [Bacillota bacterium]OZV10661.1 glutamyl-tRNA reductase [Tissierella sp. P1]